jgi:hypothetical protein
MPNEPAPPSPYETRLREITGKLFEAAHTKKGKGFESTLAVLRSELSGLLEAKRLLRRIIADLPQRRDWLDPQVEKAAKALLAEEE